MPESPFDVELRAGRIERAEPFPKTRKPDMLKLWIDLGSRKIQSCAQLGHHYTPDELVGRQVLCAVNLGTVNIAGFESQALTVGISDDGGHPILVVPDKEVPLGAVVH